MKTFRWTVPDPPMTEREKRPPAERRKPIPGFGMVAMGLATMAMSLMDLSIANGFGRGLQTYFWKSAEGTVTAAEFRRHRTLASGDVTFEVTIEEMLVEGTEDVTSPKWNTWAFSAQKLEKSLEEKYEKWSSQYEVGKKVTIYYANGGEMSLGHWPDSMDFDYGWSGIMKLLLGVWMAWAGQGLLRENWKNGARSKGMANEGAQEA